jgi:phosphatidylethanolamine-binding protein
LCWSRRRGVDVPTDEVTGSIPVSSTHVSAAQSPLPARLVTGGFCYWVLVGLPATTTELPTGASAPADLPEGAFHVRNGAGGLACAGAFPPAGDIPHRYVFTDSFLWRLISVVATQSAEPGCRTAGQPVALRLDVLEHGTHVAGHADTAAHVAVAAKPFQAPVRAPSASRGSRVRPPRLRSSISRSTTGRRCAVYRRPMTHRCGRPGRGCR